MFVLALFVVSAEGKNRGSVAESVSKRIMQKWHEIDTEIHKRHPLKHIRRVIHH